MTNPKEKTSWRELITLGLVAFANSFERFVDEDGNEEWRRPNDEFAYDMVFLLRDLLNDACKWTGGEMRWSAGEEIREGLEIFLRDCGQFPR